MDYHGGSGQSVPSSQSVQLSSALVRAHRHDFSGPPPTSSIEDHISNLKLGDHLCLIYGSFEEQMTTIIPYFKAGLARGERCVYIADDRSADQVLAALAGGGVDVQREVDRGALVMLTKRDAYLRAGHFEPRAMIAFLQQAIDETMALGFSGLRATGEMTWALGPEVGNDRLIEYEALLNETVFAAGSRAVGLCQYNRHRFPPEIIEGVLRTHPVAVLGDQVCPNLYYDPPDLVLGKGPASARVEWMIAQLKWARKAAKELEDANSLLEYRVAERTAAMEDLLRSISHDLRTPLSVLQGYAQLLLRHADKPQLVHQSAENIYTSATRINAMIHDLVDSSRWESGQLDLNRVAVDLPSFISELKDRLANALPIERARLEVPSDLPTVSADPARLERILINLLSNALKYSENEIVVRAEVSRDDVQVSVADRGPGLSPHEMDHVFDRFYRATSSQKADGLGLGLYITKMLVAAHGGRIWVESRPGEGTTFFFTIPRAAS